MSRTNISACEGLSDVPRLFVYRLLVCTLTKQLVSQCSIFPIAYKWHVSSPFVSRPSSCNKSVPSQTVDQSIAPHATICNLYAQTPIYIYIYIYIYIVYTIAFAFVADRRQQ